MTALFLAAVLAVSLLLPAGSASAQEQLLIGYGTTSINFFPTWFAGQLGLYEKHGVNVRLTELVGGPAIQALMSGSMHMYDGGTSSLAARDEGMPVIVIAQGGPNNFSIYGQPEVKDVHDLRGRIVAIAAPGTSHEYVLLQLLEYYNIDPDEIRMTFTQTSPGIFAALIAGHADAGIFAPPTTIQAQDAGFKLLADVVELGLPGAGNYWIVNENWANNNRDKVKAVLKAYSEAVAIAKSMPAEELAEYLSQFYGIDDLDLLTRTAAQFVPRYLSIPRVQEDSIAAMITAMGLKSEPSSYHDPSYVDELEREGFYRSLGIE